MQQQKQKLEILGKRILNASRTELLLAMPFLAAPLSALSYEMDLSTATIGTDAYAIRFNPQYLFRLYTENPARLNRAYLHILLHCLFGHMFAAPRFPDGALWNVCCDIAVEQVLDTMESEVTRRVTSDFRQQVYAGLREKIGTLTAEKLYAFFDAAGDADALSAGDADALSAGDAHEGSVPGDMPDFTDYRVMDKIAAEFFEDDHGFWERMWEDETKNKQEDESTPVPQMPMPPALLRRVKEQWERDAKRVKSELDLLSKKASGEAGSLSWTLAALYGKRTDYKAWLGKLAVMREEARPDPENFDMGMYQYGLLLYGNLPLIEELELREAKKIDELVIAIDTSASCAREQVQKFLNETASLLKQQETFFHRVDVRILECDEHVQNELCLTDVSEMERYAKEFTVKGGFGTDFRPVFSHIASLRARGELCTLRGLLYFTDGYGIYPKDAPPYETAFVFDTASDFDDRNVPPWAVKLYSNP